MFIGFRIRLKDLLWLVPAVVGMVSGLLVTYPDLWWFLKHIIPV